MFNLFGRGKGSSRDKIENPAILICTIGNAPTFAQDKAIYQPYSNITEFKASTLAELEGFLAGKTFDVVHLFVNFTSEGTVEGRSGLELLRLLSQDDAKIAMFACDNPVEHYIAAFPAAQTKGLDNMNMVMTLERQDEKFFNFFKKMFELMAQGKTMPIAWVTIAPQHDGPWMKELPGCLFMPKRGHLKFVP